MGLINPDSYVTNIGVDKTNTYISFGTNGVTVYKNGTDENGNTLFTVSSVANIYWDKDAREAGKAGLSSVPVSTSVSGDPGIDQGVYVLLYARLKVMFPNAYDA